MATRIDVHAHYLPQVFTDALAAAGRRLADGRATMPDWTPEAAIEAMDRYAVATAMLSRPTQFEWLDATGAGKLARQINEAGASVVADHPKRFGAFASLPMLHTAEALEETKYSLDELRLDGISLVTNYDGAYLGDARFDAIFDELNRRSAVVFIHPTAPPNVASLTMGYSADMMEFVFETTRAVANLALSGTLDRCPDVRFILPHLGGTLPYIAERVERIGGRQSPAKRPLREYLAGMYYDCTSSTSVHQMSSLLQLVGVDRVLYGTDWPLASDEAISRYEDYFEANPLLDDSSRQLINHHNALALFPRLRDLIEE